MPENQSSENPTSEITEMGATPIVDPADSSLHFARDGEADAEVRSIIGEWANDATAKELFANTLAPLAPLRARIAENARVQAATTDADLSPVVDRAGDVALLYVDAQDRLRNRLDGIQTDFQARIHGERGRDEEIKKAGWDRENSFLKADARLESVLQMADNTGPVGLQITPTPDMLGEAQLVLSKFPVMSAVGFVRDGLAVLDRASDPAISQPERTKANYQLQNAWMPLLERRATSPERFAQKYAPLAEMAHSLIKEHLDTVTGVTRAKTAADTKALILSEIRTMKQMLPSMHDAKDTIILGAPNLFPKKQA
jgi:hypothetical protein